MKVLNQTIDCMKCLYVIFSALHNVSYFHELEFSTGSYKGILPHFPQIALKKKKQLARHRAHYSTVRQLIHLLTEAKTWSLE